MNGEGVRRVQCTVGVTSFSCFLENWELFHREEVGCSGVHPPGHPAHHQVPGPGGADHSEHRRWGWLLEASQLSVGPFSAMFCMFLPQTGCCLLSHFSFG